MSALAEALVAAQSRAVAVLGKQYVAGKVTNDGAKAALTTVGLTDAVDADRWLAALALIKAGGGEAPAETTPEAKPDPAVEKMSSKQADYIRKLCEEKKQPLPDDFELMTKAQASDAIGALQAGTYDPLKYRIPF